jgi:hypothetical protein
MKKILNFFLCFLQDDCVYSIKKLLCFIFSGVIIYLAIFTDKTYYDLLIFVGALLGIRAWERNQANTLGVKKPTKIE